MRHYDKFYIDGEWVDPVSSRPFELINPATEEPFATVSLGSAEDVDRAVKAARAAFPAFSSTSARERIALLERIIEAYSARVADLAVAVTEEIGSPKSATVQATGGLDHLRQAITTLGEYEFERRMGNTVIRREPIGVCGLISPWNWPVQTPLHRSCLRPWRRAAR